MSEQIPKMMICVQCKKAGEKELCIVGGKEPFTEAQAAEVIRRAEAYEGLATSVLLQQEVGNWANRVFGKTQTTTGIINHLIKEVCELRDSDAPDEAADCLLLLFQHAHENGYDLLEEAKKKHEINLTRKWGKPDEHGVIEHIREQALEAQP